MAIYGKTLDEIRCEKEEKEEKEFEEWCKKVEAMSDEEFEKTFGYTREEEKARTDKMMDEFHWYDCLIHYELNSKGGAKNPYSLREVASLIRHFYFTGKRHQAEGLDFDFNGNEVPAAEGWEVKKHEKS